LYLPSKAATGILGSEGKGPLWRSRDGKILHDLLY